jgi:PKD repeat protein
VYIVTANRSTSITTPAGWALLDTEQDGSPDVTSWVFTRTADGSTAGSTVTVSLGAQSKTSGLLVAYQNATPPTVALASVMGAASTELTTPATTVSYDGSAVISYWADKTGGNTGWTVPGTVVERAASVGSGGGRITAAIADAFVGSGSWPGATATTTSSGAKGIAWTIVIAPSTGNVAPVATFSSTCTLLACDFDGSASSDADGTIVSYDWDFGDGTTASGPTASHEYAASGSYTVALTVTDDGGAATTHSELLLVDLAAVVQLRGTSSTNLTSSIPTVSIPPAVETGDQLVLFASSNSAVDATTPAGWTLLGTAEDGQPDLRSWVFTRTAEAADGSSSVTVPLSSLVKTSLVLLAYAGADPISVANSSVAGTTSTDASAPPAAVATNGSVVVSYWVDKTSGNTGWTMPGTVTLREQSIGSGGGRITAAAGDAGAAAGTWPGATATSSVSGGKAIGWTVVVPAP